MHFILCNQYFSCWRELECGSTTVSYSVHEYQVEAQHPTLSLSSPLTPFSPEELGDLLIKAVEDKTPTEVGCYLIHLAACN